ncbi:MAG: PfkB family carbohydrate kinase [Myxococcales bacterium]
MHRQVVVAGNYSHDTLIGGDAMQRCPPIAVPLTVFEERSELGGSAAYVCAVLRPAKIDFAVVANVGDDFRYADRVPPARRVPGARTTSFLDDYRTGERIATLRAAAPPLSPEDLCETCTVGLAVAVAGEIPAATLLRLRELSAVLLADAQGFVRAFDPVGRVLHRAPTPDVLAALERVDYLKAGRAEAEALDLSQLRRSCTILLTDGPRGCTILTATGEQHISAFPAREVDPTGAGDCFLAGFAVGLLRGWPPSRSALLGNWCGARAVESPGLPTLDGVPDLD